MNRLRMQPVLVLALSFFAIVANAQTVTLNRSLGDFESAGLIGVTADGQTAVYHVSYIDQESPPSHAKESIYTVRVGGGESRLVFQVTRELLGPHVLTPDHFLVARLSSRLEWGGQYYLDRLVSVNLADGTSTDLNSGVPGVGYHQETLQLTADGRTLVFRQSMDTDDKVYDLYSVPTAGGPWVKLNGGYGVWERFLITPDQTRVVYVEEPADHSWALVRVVPIGGGAALPLTPHLAPLGNFEVTSDSQTLVYNALQDSSHVELYAVPLAGGSPRKLNRPVAPSAHVTGIFGFTLSPQGDRVAYVGTQDTADVLEVYTVPVAGGEIVKLNPPLVANGDVNKGYFGFSPDGSHVVYYADQQVDGREDIYSVPSLGGLAIRLNPVTEEADPGSRMGLIFTSDSRYVFWENTNIIIARSRLDTTETLQLFTGEIRLSADEQQLISASTATQIRRSPLSGSPLFVLTDPMLAGWSIRGYWLSPDMTRLVYEAASSTSTGIFSKPCGLTPELGAAADQPPAQIALAWSDDSPCSPTQYLGFAYDVYGSQFVQRGWNGTMWFPFGWWTRAGQLDVGQTGAYFAWISSQWPDGQWEPCLNPQALIVYSGAPHTPTGAWAEQSAGGSSAGCLAGNGSAASTGWTASATSAGATRVDVSETSETWRLHWNPEIYGTWLDQIAIYQNGVGWIAPLDGPSHAFPQFSPWTFLDYGGLAYDLAKGNFFNGWADFTLPPGGSFVFFLNFKAWDASTQGPFAFAAGN